MRITTKLWLWILLTVGATWGLGSYATHVARRALSESILATSTDYVRVVMDQVDRSIHRSVADWRAISRMGLVRDTLERSNAELEAESDAQGLIDRRDRRWSEDADEPLALVDELTSGQLAEDLRARLDELRYRYGYPVYGEVVLTNRFGANVAQTSRTTDYRQDDEPWWEEAAEHGLFVGPVAVDESSGMRGIAIAIGIREDDGELAGVLKTILNFRVAAEVLEAEARARPHDARERLALIDPEGRLLHGFALGEEHETRWGLGHLAREIDREGPGTEGSFHATLGDEPIVASYARSKGHDALPGTGRTLLLQQDPAVLFAPVESLGRRITFIAVTVTVVSLLIGVALVLHWSREIGALTRATAALRRGDMSARVCLGGTDELAMLGAGFNAMAEDLERSSRDLRLQAETLSLQNAELEEQVRERARASEEKQRYEAQLRQAQKFEAVGQLAAGVAHEINTPTQFVSDNTRFLGDSFSKLMDVIAACGELDGCGDGIDEAVERVVDVARRTKLDFLREEIPAALEESMEGLERISKIVRAMKDFSHPGSGRKEPVDVNEAIESTVTVARNEWKYVADVELDLDPGLSPVLAIRDQLNQVVLNLVVNAAHAIGSSRADGEPKGTIELATQKLDGKVEIRVRDTGCGIPAEIRDRVFDPFFTTKELGKGTGQGLAVAYSAIVDKHGGTIEVESEVGVGTTFVIRLPAEEDRDAVDDRAEELVRGELV